MMFVICIYGLSINTANTIFVKKETFKISSVLFHKKLKKYHSPFPIPKTVSTEILNYFYAAICISVLAITLSNPKFYKKNLQTQFF